MLREPVAIQITRAALDAVAAAHPKCKSADAAWRAFAEWNGKRGRVVALSYEERPPFFPELQDLIEFGIGACPALGREGFLREAGRRLGRVIIKERLPDFVELCLSGEGDPVGGIERLVVRFIDRYTANLFQVVPDRSAHAISCRFAYTDPAASERHLRASGHDPGISLRNSLLLATGAIESGFAFLLDPWDPSQVAVEEAACAFRLRIPAVTRFSYRGLAGVLTEFAQAVQARHTDELFARDLEHELLLKSPLMREAWEKIRRASASDELILLRGEPGTGKTFLASRIHEMSARKGRPFVEVGLTADVGAEGLVQSQLFGHVKGAFTSAHEDRPGLFSMADTGTLFLDEIGDASSDTQAKLLRVIEKRTFKPLGSTRDVTVDVRILAATNRDLERLVREGKFREDLYHRLDMIQIELPPLRERASEIPTLCAHFLRRLSAELKKPSKRISAGVMDLFSRHAWPGNIRELIHVLKYALLFSEGDEVRTGDLPPQVRPGRVSQTVRAMSGSEVIDFDRLLQLLEEGGGAVPPAKDRSDCPWHIEHAKKIYLRALISHFRGNLRKITAFWDRASERAVRALIRKYGLTGEIERARKGS